MAYHHFCVTLSSLTLTLAFLLHFSPTFYSNAADLFQDESRFKAHPRHHRYHSSLNSNRPYHNQDDTQVAYLPILVISIVISLFLIVNCYKKESSPHIPDLTETSRLSAFLSRACSRSTPLHAPRLIIPLNNKPNCLPTKITSSTLNHHSLQSGSSRSSNFNHNANSNEDNEDNEDNECSKKLVLQSVIDVDDECPYYQQQHQQHPQHQQLQQQQHYLHHPSRGYTHQFINTHPQYHQFYQYQQCPNSDYYHVNCSSSTKSIITVTPNPIVSLLSSPC